MYCKSCGKEMSDGARFCANCGAVVDASDVAPEVPTSPPPPAAPPPVPAYPPALPPALPPAPVKSRRGLWIALSALAVVVIAAAVALPLLLTRDGDEPVVVSTSTTARPSTTTQAATGTSTLQSTTSEPADPEPATTTVTEVVGDPGDSDGEWVETEIPGAPDRVLTAALSNDVLLMLAESDSGYGLYAYYFLLDEMVEIPLGSGEVGGIDVDDTHAVWWEGTYDEDSGSYLDQHIYSYTVPDGPKVEVAGEGRNVGFPQISGMFVTWVEDAPWGPDPDNYVLVPIYAQFFSGGEAQEGEPMELVPSAVAPIMGDSTWTYSLGKTYLAWEQGAAVGSLDTGTYVIDLMDPLAEPRSVGINAWRPSVYLDNLVYWEDGLRLLRLGTDEEREIDPQGDFPTTAGSFVAYFRSVAGDEETRYEIVAKGLTGGHEQVLGEASDAPWLLPPVAACGNRVAFVSDSTVRMFEWRGR